jgi:molybdopterin synthase catalytic subunit
MANEQRNHVRIQIADFSIAEEIKNLRAGSQAEVGAIVTFSGLVRDSHADNTVTKLYIEHYPGMTEKALEKIIMQARQRWSIQQVTVIHRIGELYPTDQIVFVGVASAHRASAFNACEFIMDYLKTDAPFWKKEWRDDQAHWVEQRDSDSQAKHAWNDALHQRKNQRKT